MLVIGDGRDQYLKECIESMTVHLPVDDIVEWWMHDDTGSETYRADLVTRYPQFRHIHGGPRLGCAGAYRSAWSQVLAHTGADYIFLIEQDFRFIRPVPLDDMADLLEHRGDLAQVALRRQPWNESEKAAGGIVEWHPDWYQDQTGWGHRWLEHTAFFTTNPCLFRSSLLRVPWPLHQPGVYSEGTFHQRLMVGGTPEVPGSAVRYAYWGSRDSGVWVEHIGYERVGRDY